MDEGLVKPVEWVGSSKTDLKRFPDAVQDRMGFAIYQAQIGLKHLGAKPLRGYDPGILEVVARHDGDTYRAVYTVRFGETIYVLQAFQKKTKKGIVTPKRELDLVRQRLKLADQYHKDIINGA